MTTNVMRAPISAFMPFSVWLWGLCPRGLRQVWFPSVAILTADQMTETNPPRPCRVPYRDLLYFSRQRVELHRRHAGDNWIYCGAMLRRSVAQSLPWLCPVDQTSNLREPEWFH